jgi:PIN domain nuclease of toxin-antitoxin system
VRLLLDTHAFVWWLTDEKRLSKRARELIGDDRNDLYWSVASTWELAIKIGLGHLTIPDTLAAFLAEALNQQSIVTLPIQQLHACRVAELPNLHRDPFDRLLVAQAQVDRLTLLSKDRQVQRYDVEVVW